MLLLETAGTFLSIGLCGFTPYLLVHRYICIIVVDSKQYSNFYQEHITVGVRHYV